MTRERITDFVELVEGDCRKGMATMAPESVDSIVTDPPYGLSFMGKGWDHGVPGVEFWTEALRVLKPGGHLLAFGGTRTVHRLTCAIEDAGFEIRDCIMWLYGSGFPKSLDVGKAITATQKNGSSSMQSLRKARLGDDYKPTGQDDPNGDTFSKKKLGWTPNGDRVKTEMTDAAKRWAGWGTALKPACEPVIVARKPLIGTVAQNVMKHGTGAINIDGCRVGTNGEAVPVFGTSGGRKFEQTHTQPERRTKQVGSSAAGRWPANVIHDGSEEVLAGFPVTGASKSAARGSVQRYDPADEAAKRPKGGNGIRGHDDNGGSAARFFYSAKCSKADRDGSTHPTMKPTALMRYLCRLVTPPGGTILDPFAGSGSTGKAAIAEGFHALLMEQDPAYAEIIRHRLASDLLPDLFSRSK